MTDDSKAKWDTRYRDADGPPVAAAVLSDNAHLLPVQGAALDLACGLGGNALLLSAHGLTTDAWDLSSVAIDKLDQLAHARRLFVHTSVRDAVKSPPGPDRYDVIVISRFLERELAGAVVEALREHGLLFYQTFTREKVDEFGPSGPAYRLMENELLRLFEPLRVVLYREEGRIGDHTKGFRNEAMFIGQKR